MSYNPWLDFQLESLDFGDDIVGRDCVAMYPWMIGLPNGEFVCWYPLRWQFSHHFGCWGRWWERWRWYTVLQPHWQTVRPFDFDGYDRGDGIWMGKWRWIPHGHEPWL
jgi:hypothetical protein